MDFTEVDYDNERFSIATNPLYIQLSPFSLPTWIKIASWFDHCTHSNKTTTNNIPSGIPPELCKVTSSTCFFLWR